MDNTGSAYVLRDGKRLRRGYTTGACAAAAAKAAALLLLTGAAAETVEFTVPAGVTLTLPVSELRLEGQTASCAVQKDSGDDPDVTDGILICAAVRRRGEAGIVIDGGEGVGRITKPGLKLAVGQAAINPGPREMIRQAVEEVLARSGQSGGLSVLISVPEGVEIGKKTFNPRLGILGGISILGTTGIVEPMSVEALLESLALEIRQKRALGVQRLLLTPGSWGAGFARERWGLEDPVRCANYIGPALDLASEAGFRQTLLIGHVGKLVKLSGGMMDTHSRAGDCRGELMAAHALRAGADGALARAILDCVATDEMLRLLRQAGLLEGAMAHMAERMDFYLRRRAGAEMEVGAVAFSDVYGILCAAGPARAWLAEQDRRQEGGT